MMRQFTEKAKPSSWELMNSRLTTVEPVWEWTRLSTSGRQLYILFFFWDPWKWDQDLSLVHELVFLKTPLFPVVEFLAQPWYKGEGLGPALKSWAKFCWLPMGSLTFWKEWVEMWEWKVGNGRESSAWNVNWIKNKKVINKELQLLYPDFLCLSNLEKIFSYPFLSV